MESVQLSSKPCRTETKETGISSSQITMQSYMHGPASWSHLDQIWPYHSRVSIEITYWLLLKKMFSPNVITIINLSLPFSAKISMLVLLIVNSSVWEKRHIGFPYWIIQQCFYFNMLYYELVKCFNDTMHFIVSFN